MEVFLVLFLQKKNILMRIFVCEFVTGGGFAGAPIPAGLRAEGEMMLRALLADLAAVPGVRLRVCRDARLAAFSVPAETVAVEADAFWDIMRAEIAAAEAFWPIAPESDGILLRLSAMARGKILLGSSPEAVRLCTSKTATARHLAAHGVPTAPALAPGIAAPHGAIVKPDDGAGAEGVRFFADPAAALATARGTQGLIAQPFIAGAPESLSLLCNAGEATLLSCNRQIIARLGDEFHYRGFVVGGAEEKRALYTPLAAAIARAIPDLFGYVGVDLIAASSGPVVLEINPRLTTSYAALGEALGVNPAAMVLALAAGGVSPPAVSARPVTLALP